MSDECICSHMRSDHIKKGTGACMGGAEVYCPCDRYSPAPSASAGLEGPHRPGEPSSAAGKVPKSEG